MTSAWVDGGYLVGVAPHDGHGHDLSFRIDDKTGAIDGVAAGHMVPADPDQAP